MTYPTNPRLCTTEGFVALEKDSRDRNRGPNEKLMQSLDPEGTHVAAQWILHNEVEWRIKWLVKLKGEGEPAIVFMDNGFEAVDKYTFEASGKQSDTL